LEAHAKVVKTKKTKGAFIEEHDDEAEEEEEKNVNE